MRGIVTIGHPDALIHRKDPAGLYGLETRPYIAASGSETTMPVEGMQAERLLRLYAYWEEKRGASAMPARADISPFDFTYVLGDVVLVEAHREPLRFRYRLHGVNLVGRDGYDMTGKWLHDHPEPGYANRIMQTWTSVAETGKPHHVVREIVVDGRVRHYESLVLPLGADHRTIDMLLGAQIYLG